MYVITRRDLPGGDQAAQAIHASFLFSHEHPVLMDSWFTESSYLVLLAAPDEAELIRLEAALTRLDIPVSVVREPDFDGQVTAIAVAPNPAVNRLVSSLPLALKERAMA